MADDLRALEEQERDELSKVARSERATRLLENEYFVEAVKAVNDQLCSEFMHSAIDDEKTRTNARIGVDMLDRILKAVRHHVETGKIAKKNLTDIREKKSFLRR